MRSFLRKISTHHILCGHVCLPNIKFNYPVSYCYKQVFILETIHISFENKTIFQFASEMLLYLCIKQEMYQIAYLVWEYEFTEFASSVFTLCFVVHNIALSWLSPVLILWEERIEFSCYGKRWFHFCPQPN